MLQATEVRATGELRSGNKYLDGLTRKPQFAEHFLGLYRVSVDSSLKPRIGEQGPLQLTKLRHIVSAAKRWILYAIHD